MARSQLKCQYKPNEDWQSKCNLPKSEHESGVHPFTQKPLTCQECGGPVDDDEHIYDDFEKGEPLVLCSQQCRNEVLDNRAADERED